MPRATMAAGSRRANAAIIRN